MADPRRLRRFCRGQSATRIQIVTLLFGTLFVLAVGPRLFAQRSNTTLEDFYPALRQTEQPNRHQPGWGEPPRRMYQNYAGDVIYQFDNYDIRIPISRGEFPNENTPGAPVVAKNSWGMHWDGSNRFISPNYAFREVTRNWYILNIIGEPAPLKWPFDEPRRGVVAPRLKRRYLEPAPVYQTVDLQPRHGPASLGIAVTWPPQVSTPKPEKEVAPAAPKLKMSLDDLQPYDARTSTRPIAIRR